MSEARNLLASCGFKHARGMVIAACCDPLAVRTEGHSSYGVLMSETRNLLASCSFKHARGVVIAARRNPLAIGAEGHRSHSRRCCCVSDCYCSSMMIKARHSPNQEGGRLLHCCVILQRWAPLHRLDCQERRSYVGVNRL